MTAAVVLVGHLEGMASYLKHRFFVPLSGSLLGLTAGVFLLP